MGRSNQVYCSDACGSSARRADSLGGPRRIPTVSLAPRVATRLDALALEFDRVMRTDPAHIIARAREGFNVAAKRGDLADAA